MLQKIFSEKVNDYIVLVLGVFLLCLGINLFVVSSGLFNGGVLGISQISRTLLERYFNIKFNFDIAGIINFILNIPILILAYTKLSKRFFFKTAISVVLQTIFFTLIKIPTTPILNDMFASILVGAVISGLGSGLLLLSGASGGGIDVIGVYSSMKMKNFSVGGVNIIINMFIFTLSAVLFDIATGIYSAIYMFIYSYSMDKFHYQNIEEVLIVVTKNKNIKKEINSKFYRGVTCWNGKGAYTDSDVEILMTAVDKSEVKKIKALILSMDSHAFIVMNEANVRGNFVKKLT